MSNFHLYSFRPNDDTNLPCQRYLYVNSYLVNDNWKYMLKLKTCIWLVTEQLYSWWHLVILYLTLCFGFLTCLVWCICCLILHRLTDIWPPQLIFFIKDFLFINIADSHILYLVQRSEVTIRLILRKQTTKLNKIILVLSLYSLPSSSCSAMNKEALPILGFVIFHHGHCYSKCYLFVIGFVSRIQLSIQAASCQRHCAPYVIGDRGLVI